MSDNKKFLNIFKRQFAKDPLWKLIKSGVNNVGEGMNKSAKLKKLKQFKSNVKKNRDKNKERWSKRLSNVKKNLDYQYGSFIKNLPFVNATKIKKELKNK